MRNFESTVTSHAMASRLPGQPLAFSTDDVPSHQRIDYWEERNVQAIVGLKCSTLAERGLQASAQCFNFGSLRAVDISGNEHVIERSPKLVDNYEKDSIFLCLIAKGSAFVYRANEFVPLSTGDLVVYDTNLAYMHGFPSDMRQIIFDFPGAEFRRRFGHWRQAGPLRLDGQIGTGRVVAGLLREKLAKSRRALSSPAPSDPISRDHALLDAELWDLLAIAVGVTQPAANARAAMVLSALRARRCVSERAGDPRLNCEAVAQAAGLSVRHLNRVLAAERTTIAELIWHTRLDRARADLASPASRGATIGEVAYRWGFSSHAHFTRSFRDRFGMTPSALRGGSGSASTRG